MPASVIDTGHTAVADTKHIPVGTSQQFDEPDVAGAQEFWQSVSTAHSGTH